MIVDETIERRGLRPARLRDTWRYAEAAYVGLSLLLPPCTCRFQVEADIIASEGVSDGTLLMRDAKITQIYEGSSEAEA